MSLLHRPLYLNRLNRLLERDEVKILVGARGVGKTSILDMFAQSLLLSGVKRANIVRIDLDALTFRTLIDAEEFFDLISTQIADQGKTYLLLDEPARIPNWQMVVSGVKNIFGADIYITSSVEIAEEDLTEFFDPLPIFLNVLPLSFQEFQIFYRFSEEVPLKERLEVYLKVGGMPAAVQMRANESALTSMMLSNFSASLMADVLSGVGMTDYDLMINLTKKIFAQFGAVNSFNSLRKMFDERPPKVTTIENYIERLRKAYLFYAVPVIDLRDGTPIPRMAKYFPVDLGYQTLMIGEQVLTDEILECLVYLEILRLEVGCTIFRVGKSTVFQIERSDLGDKIYIKTAKNLESEEAQDAAYTPLRTIKNLFARWVITSDENATNSDDGIKVTNVLDFLTSE
ncbi:MAG: ATP-binding protein [Selenomonadaceae bacterium]|nr:ATP-binding protein [Selenomonadaceae bacterium]